MATQEDKDWERYKALKHGITFYNASKVGGLDEDVREIALLDAKYPHFEAKWRKETPLRPLPLVNFGGKRKRSRRSKRKHTRNATQSHRRVKA